MGNHVMVKQNLIEKMVWFIFMRNFENTKNNYTEAKAHL